MLVSFRWPVVAGPLCRSLDALLYALLPLPQCQAESVTMKIARATLFLIQSATLRGSAEIAIRKKQGPEQ